MPQGAKGVQDRSHERVSGCVATLSSPPLSVGCLATLTRASACAILGAVGTAKCAEGGAKPMRIMCLNGWGGTLGDALLAYLSDNAPDVLCLQEVVHSPATDKTVLTYRDGDHVLPQRANLFREVSAALPRQTATLCAAALGETRSARASRARYFVPRSASNRRRAASQTCASNFSLNRRTFASALKSSMLHSRRRR